MQPRPHHQHDRQPGRRWRATGSGPTAQHREHEQGGDEERSSGWRHSQASARAIRRRSARRVVRRAEPPTACSSCRVHVAFSFGSVGYLLKAPRAESSSTVRWATSRARLSWVFLKPPRPERDAAQGAAQFPHGLVEFFDDAVDGAGHQSAASIRGRSVRLPTVSPTSDMISQRLGRPSWRRPSSPPGWRSTSAPAALPRYRGRPCAATFSASARASPTICSARQNSP